MADRVIKPDSGNQLVLQDEGGSASLTIATDGDVSLTQDIYLASGKGIYFDGGTTAANYLGGSDAYETGTWTPVIKTGASGFSNTVTFTGGTQTFLYTKVGNLCHVMFAVDAATASAPTTPEIKIEGFPFTFKAGSAWYPGTPILINSLGLDLSADSIVAGSAGNSHAYVMSHAGSGYGFTDASDSGTSWMYFQLTYLME